MTILYDFGMLMLLSLIVIIFIIIVIVTNICVIVYQQQWFLISYLDCNTIYKLSNKNKYLLYLSGRRRGVYISQRTSWYCKRKFEPLDSRLQIRASRAPPTASALQWIRPHKRFVRSSDSPSQVTQSSNPVTFTNPNEPKWSVIVRSVFAKISYLTVFAGASTTSKVSGLLKGAELRPLVAGLFIILTISSTVPSSYISIGVLYWIFSKNGFPTRHDRIIHWDSLSI